LSHLTELHAACDADLAFCNSTSFLQCGRTPAWYYFSTVLPSCSSVMRQCVFMKIQLHSSHATVECENKFLMRLDSYRPPYDVDFAAKERVILLSGHPSGVTQLLHLGTVSFAHVKAERNKCLNLKIKITFLLKYPVCAINRTIFFTFEWFEILESYVKKRL